MRSPHSIVMVVAALVAIALVAPAMAAAAPVGSPDPIIGRVFPVLTRLVLASARDFTLGMTGPSGSSTGSSANVNVTFSIASPQPVGTPVPVFRFFSPKSGTHFYTPSAEERDMVIARWSAIWSFEGVAYWVNPAKNNQPLYRFYNFKNGSHFYTASVAERDSVIARLSNIYQYDGPTYAVTPYSEAGKVAVYRFYNFRNGSHFYTADPAERDNVIGRLSNIYQFEGPAFWLGQ